MTYVHFLHLLANELVFYEETQAQMVTRHHAKSETKNEEAKACIPSGNLLSMFSVFVRRYPGLCVLDRHVLVKLGDLPYYTKSDSKGTHRRKCSHCGALTSHFCIGCSRDIMSDSPKLVCFCEPGLYNHQCFFSYSKH